MKYYSMRFMFAGSPHTKDISVELNDEDFFRFVAAVQTGIANKEPFTVRGSNGGGIVLNLAKCTYFEWN